MSIFKNNSQQNQNNCTYTIESCSCVQRRRLVILAVEQTYSCEPHAAYQADQITRQAAFSWSLVDHDHKGTDETDDEVDEHVLGWPLPFEQIVVDQHENRREIGKNVGMTQFGEMARNDKAAHCYRLDYTSQKQIRVNFKTALIEGQRQNYQETKELTPGQLQHWRGLNYSHEGAGKSATAHCYQQKNRSKLHLIIIIVTVILLQP